MANARISLGDNLSREQEEYTINVNFAYSGIPINPLEYLLQICNLEEVFLSASY